MLLQRRCNGVVICLTGEALMNTIEIKFNNVNNFRIFAKS